MAALAQCCRQTPFSLRQHGAFHFICISFCARRAQNEMQTKMTYRCERSLLSCRVSSVNEERRNIESESAIADCTRRHMLRQSTVYKWSTKEFLMRTKHTRSRRNQPILISLLLPLMLMILSSCGGAAAT